MDTITIQKGSRALHGEMTVQEAYGVPCRVTEVGRTRKTQDGQRWPQYDLEAFIQPEDLTGKMALLYDDTQFIYDGRKYTLHDVRGVKDFDGAVDHYHLKLKAVEV
jgi:hypothetical protein